MKERKILFNISELDYNDLQSIGVYKITNSINNHFYIGSTSISFISRFKQHCRDYAKWNNCERRCCTPILYHAFNKYGIQNFSVKIILKLNGYTQKEILEKEEYYIQQLHPQYNICQYPTYGGKPNLNRKLTTEWKQHIAEKSSLYKHSKETLKKVSINNKKNAVKVRFISIHDPSIIHEFNSWVEAGKYFNKRPSIFTTAYRRKKQWRDWIIEKKSTQAKKIKVFTEKGEIIFKAYNECDRYFNMWRGYTSTVINKKTNELILNKYKYELL